MNVRNYISAIAEDDPNCHGGEGIVRNVELFHENDFHSSIKYMNYAVLSPGTSIGIHRHDNDEELYIVLEGEGVMDIDGELKNVSSGDVIVNKPYGSHGLTNKSEKDLKILVIEVGIHT